MSKLDVFLYFHILSAFLIVAGAAISTATGMMMAKTNSTRGIAMLSGLAHKAEMFVIIPGALGAIIFGTALVKETGYDYGDSWVSASYVLWIIAIVLGAGVLGRIVTGIHHQAGELVAQ